MATTEHQLPCFQMTVHDVPVDRDILTQQLVAMATTEHQLPCFQMIVHHIPGIPVERYVIIQQQLVARATVQQQLP